jgi:hypothetical protein
MAVAKAAQTSRFFRKTWKQAIPDSSLRRKRVLFLPRQLDLRIFDTGRKRLKDIKAVSCHCDVTYLFSMTYLFVFYADLSTIDHLQR